MNGLIDHTSTCFLLLTSGTYKLGLEVVHEVADTYKSVYFSVFYISSTPVHLLGFRLAAD